MISGASDVLDPVEVAKDGVSRSKHLIASTLDDLSQHHSWLESYHRAERRRAERLRRQEALHRLELRRQRAAWTLRRYAIATYAAARTSAAFTMHHGRAFAAWAAPKARDLATKIQSVLSAGLTWSSRTAPRLARDGRMAAMDAWDAAQRGFAWSVGTSDEAGIVFRRELAARVARLSAYAAALSEPAHRRAMIAVRRTRHRAWAQARLLEAGFALRMMRVAQDAEHLLTHYAPGRRSRTGRALIVRPNTALICIEPVRAKVPAICARQNGT